MASHSSNSSAEIFDLSEICIPSFSHCFIFEFRKVRETKLSFEKGLEKTIQWYMDNPEIMNNVSQKILNHEPWKSSN